MSFTLVRVGLVNNEDQGHTVQAGSAVNRAQVEPTKNARKSRILWVAQKNNTTKKTKQPRWWESEKFQIETFRLSQILAFHRDLGERFENLDVEIWNFSQPSKI